MCAGRVRAPLGGVPRARIRARIARTIVGVTTCIDGDDARLVTLPRWLSRDLVAALLGLIGPFIVTAAMVPFRDDFSNTNAALILVLTATSLAESERHRERQWGAG